MLVFVINDVPNGFLGMVVKTKILGCEASFLTVKISTIFKISFGTNFILGYPNC